MGYHYFWRTPQLCFWRFFWVTERFPAKKKTLIVLLELGFSKSRLVEMVMNWGSIPKWDRNFTIAKGLLSLSQKYQIFTLFRRPGIRSSTFICHLLLRTKQPKGHIFQSSSTWPNPTKIHKSRTTLQHRTLSDIILIPKKNLITFSCLFLTVKNEEVLRIQGGYFLCCLRCSHRIETAFSIPFWCMLFTKKKTA